MPVQAKTKKNIENSPLRSILASKPKSENLKKILSFVRNGQF